MSNFEHYVNTTAAEHQALSTLFSEQGYRMLSLSVYGDPHNALYAAVWFKQEGPAWVTCHGLTLQAFQQFSGEWTAKGYRPTMVSATGSGAAAVFAALFEHDATSHIPLYELSEQAFVAQCQWAQHNGYRLAWGTVYGDAAHPVYAGIWEQNGHNIHWSHILSASDAQLQHAIIASTASGGEPELITPMAAPNSYLSIWRAQAVHEWSADHGLSPAAFAVKASQMQAQGLFPLRVQGGGIGPNVHFAVIWGYLPLDWLVQSETYSTGVFAVNAAQPGQYEWDALAQSQVKFTTHCPNNPEFFARCHALGIRCFPYVTFFMGYYSPSGDGWVTGGGPQPSSLRSQTYQGIDYNHHPEVYWYDSAGQVNSFTTPGSPYAVDGVNFILVRKAAQVCPNVQEYQEAMGAWVQQLLTWGADGIFVDSIGSLQPCSGPDLDHPKHSHVYNDPPPVNTQHKAYHQLLKHVRSLVKAHKPDGAVLGNTANPIADPAYMPPEFWQSLDAGMMESYLAPGYPIGTYPGAPADPRTVSWEFWHRQGNDPAVQARLKAGIQVLALCNLNEYKNIRHYDNCLPAIARREYAFLAYATARLSGFVWTAAESLSQSSPSVACPDLYRLRLGRPMTGEQQYQGVYYRIFERGVVAVNPDLHNSSLFPLASIAAAQSPGQYFINVFCDLSGSGDGVCVQCDGSIVTALAQLDAHGQVTIPSFAGRVYLFGANTTYHP